MATKLRNFWDGLTNAFSGLGSTADPRRGNRYALRVLSQQDIEAAYRSSGLLRKIIDIPAFDMVREWRDWQAKDDQIEKLEAEERRLGIQGKVLLAEILRGLGGGALILGAPGDPALPLSERLGAGSLAYLHVVNRWQLTAVDWVDDPTDALFGGPRFWQVTTSMGQRRIHPSRVVCFRGEPIPSLVAQNIEDLFWGESRVQRVLDAVENSDTAQAAFASLITKSRNTIIGIPGLTDLVSTTDGEARLSARLAALQLGESMFNATIRDAGEGKVGDGETIEHRQVSWTGIPEIMYAFATFLAAVADIPVTRLLGRAAEGMNASGDSQQKDWNKMVRARQNLSLRPCLDQLDAVLIPSALGSRPDELWWQFSPLDTPSEAEEATRFKTISEALEKIANLGVVPDQAFAKAAQNTLVENGFMPGLDAALAEIPEAERYGLSPDDDGTDPSALQAANENTVEEMRQSGAINADQAKALLTDARPRSLYVQRKLLNADEFIRWAKAQGFETTTSADELHVTICFSRTPVDWMKMGENWSSESNGNLVINPGGPRAVEALGDKGAVVLLFASDNLSWRHRQMKEAGASFDFDEYQPHVTITYQAPAGLDLEKVQPYRGKLVFGPEIFEEVTEDWEKGITEDGGRSQTATPFVDGRRSRSLRGRRARGSASSGYNPNQPRGAGGKWIETGAGPSRSSIVKRVTAAAREKGHKSDILIGEVRGNAPSSILGYVRVANGQEIRHALNKHGNAAREAVRGQKALRPADFRHIPEIVERGRYRIIGSPESAKPMRVEYRHRIGGSEYVYTETVGRARRRVALLSLYRKG